MPQLPDNFLALCRPLPPFVKVTFGAEGAGQHAHRRYAVTMARVVPVCLTTEPFARFYDSCYFFSLVVVVVIKPSAPLLGLDVLMLDP